MNKALLTVGLFAVAGASQAFTFLGTGLGKAVTISGVHNGSVFAGKLRFHDSIYGNIETVCVDLEHMIHNGQSWNVDYLSSDLLAQHMQDAGRIVSNAFADADTDAKAAALQIAVWEAVYDDGAALHLNGGSFKANTTTAIKNQAALYYGMRELPGKSIEFKAKAGGRDCGQVTGQDQMTPVPEPASIVGLASLGLAFIRRKKA